MGEGGLAENGNHRFLTHRYFSRFFSSVHFHFLMKRIEAGCVTDGGSGDMNMNVGRSFSPLQKVLMPSLSLSG